MDAEALPPQCPVHGVPAAAICARCGRFACGECLRPAPDGGLCDECHARPAARLTASARARRALLFGALGFHGLLPLLVAGGWLGRAELQAITRGEAPAAGRPYAQGAVAFAFAGAVLWGWLLFALLVNA